MKSKVRALSFFILMVGFSSHNARAFKVPENSFKIANCNGKMNLQQVHFDVFQDYIKAVLGIGPSSYTSYRHVQTKITHDYYQFTNNYDFELFILPGQIGKFSGRLFGHSHQEWALRCEFVY